MQLRQLSGGSVSESSSNPSTSTSQDSDGKELADDSTCSLRDDEERELEREREKGKSDSDIIRDMKAELKLVACCEHTLVSFLFCCLLFFFLTVAVWMCSLLVIW